MSKTLLDFDNQVLQRSNTVPVVVDFWAPWCGPCQVLGPVIEKLATEANGRWELVKVNVDDYQDLASKYNVRGIPAVKMFINGEVKAEFSGALPEQQIKLWLEKQIPNEFDKTISAIQLKIANGQVVEAERELREILTENPLQPDASFYLAKLLILSNPQKALDLFANAEKKTELLSELLPLKRLVEILLLLDTPDKLEETPIKVEFLEAISATKKENLTEGLEKFIDIIIRNKAYHDEAAREACIGIFVMLGTKHEITKKYRKRFDMALY